MGGFFLFRVVFDPAVMAVEANNPATAGNLGGLGLPVAARLARGRRCSRRRRPGLIGKTALGLRSDYLAIATLGIAEIIIAVMKNEDWLARGVKNVIGAAPPGAVRGRPAGRTPAFVDRVAGWGFDPVTASSIVVKLAYAGLFGIVLLALLWLRRRRCKSPWGRMMRAIRDNEVAAEAMGKDVTRRHLQIFILGSAVCGHRGRDDDDAGQPADARAPTSRCASPS